MQGFFSANLILPGIGNAKSPGLASAPAARRASPPVSQVQHFGRLLQAARGNEPGSARATFPAVLPSGTPANADRFQFPEALAFGLSLLQGLGDIVSNLFDGQAYGQLLESVGNFLRGEGGIEDVQTAVEDFFAGFQPESWQPATAEWLRELEASLAEPQLAQPFAQYLEGWMGRVQEGGPVELADPLSRLSQGVADRLRGWFAGASLATGQQLRQGATPETSPLVGELRQLALEGRMPQAQAALAGDTRGPHAAELFQLPGIEGLRGNNGRQTVFPDVVFVAHQNAGRSAAAGQAPVLYRLAPRGMNEGDALERLQSIIDRLDSAAREGSNARGALASTAGNAVWTPGDFSEALRSLAGNLAQGPTPADTSRMVDGVRQAQAAMADMVERMQGELRFDTHRMRAVIHLDPPSLGRLHIQMQVDENQRLTAYFQSDQSDTGDFLRQNESDLREELARQGFAGENIALLFDEQAAERFGGDLATAFDRAV